MKLRWIDASEAKLSPFAENRGRKSGDECEEVSASEGFCSRRSKGRRYPGREPVGASLLTKLGKGASIYQFVAEFGKIRE